MAVERLRQDIRLREETDYIMPVWLPFIPYILALLGFAFIVAGAFYSEESVTMPPKAIPYGYRVNPYTSSGLLFFGVSIAVIGSLINLYVIYKWIDRRNRHFKRVRILYRDLIGYLESKGKTKQAEAIRSILRQMEVEEDEKSPILWVVLVLLVGILVFYVLHFLNKDFHRHDSREKHIWEDVRGAFEEMGEPLVHRKISYIPDRSTLVYLVLTILTGGLFGLYWIYVTTKDPNEHFREHVMFEDELLEKIEKIESSF